MNKEFVPYQESLALKKLKFREPCLGAWGAHGFMTPNDVIPFLDYVTIDAIKNTTDKYMCLAPLYQQAFRWFREKYNLFGCIDLHCSTPTHWFIRIDDITINDYLYHSEDDNLNFQTYEEAEIACLRKLIEITKT